MYQYIKLPMEHLRRKGHVTVPGLKIVIGQSLASCVMTPISVSKQQMHQYIKLPMVNADHEAGVIQLGINPQNACENPNQVLQASHACCV